MSVMYSTKGLVSTFNHNSFWDIYKNNDNNQLFFSDIHEKLEGHGGTVLPRNAEFSGPGYGLTLFVKHKSWLGGAKLMVHDSATPADMRASDEVLELKGNKVYNIKVTPRSISVENGVKKLTPTRRNCNLPHEADSLNIFRWYTQSSCLFECQLKRAYRACGCIGWDYPHFSSNLRTCYGNVHRSSDGGHRCFEAFMDSGGMPSQCPQCLGSCESTSYPYTVKSKDISLYDRICVENADELGIPHFVPNQLMTR